MRAFTSGIALAMVSLQLVAALALPTVDAVLEAEAVALPLHVESPHNEDCPASHDHLFCQVVRSLAAATASRDDLGRTAATPMYAAHPPLPYRAVPSARSLVHGPTAPRPPPLG